MKKLMVPALLLSFLVAGCQANQAIHTTDGQTIITKGKPEIDKSTGLVSYYDASTGKKAQINRNQIKDMGELDN
ncbi:hypothetical protein ED28_15960 [[Pantoea] beijingensis]|uniref:Lipoprotein YgdI/YgdR-like SH3-like domain-containing protein n=1 Tax=[Pantoea] beijingensis TaxID=1324864 RepID=A0A443IA35_9GAMM|nr:MULTISPECIES: YgdI/YgdR family lipoprotein [Erwiniaceae]RWR00944.1 hypothetical protein ED28_15960 [[Pantoea] beijingensis]